ncbi:MAG: phosphatidate cytidylyltransferase [Blastocatellia bacterium]|nr:phosphatidate cytidylyltransferase [Blastocatellia bacterium]
MKRILTAIVALPILLYTVWNDIPYFFAALTAVAIILGLIEFYHLASKASLQPSTFLGYAAALAIVACFVLGRLEWVAAAMAALVILSLASALSRPDEMNKSLASVSATVLGVAYVALLLGCLVGVRMTPDTAQTSKLAAKLLTMFFAMVMLTDTGAYYTGRSIGRHKLAPRISPGKTIEGAIGGFVTAALVGPVCKYTFFPEVPLLHAIALGALIGIIGQIGDLAESMLKRGSEVKDSGNIFPGHGGMLDRTDSIMFCAPILYYYSRLFISNL